VSGRHFNIKKDFYMHSCNLSERNAKEQIQMEFSSLGDIDKPKKNDYVHGVTVQSFSSMGQMWRVKGRTTGQVHQLMSNLEYQVFLLLDLNPNIVDIKAQYPHDLKTSLNVAFELGINHPPQNQSQKKPMTTDFIVTFQGLEQLTFGIYIKYVKDFNNYRNIEKLQLEKAILAKKHQTLLIISEQEIDRDVIRNIEWFLDAPPICDHIDAAEDRATIIHKRIQNLSMGNIATSLVSLDEADNIVHGSHLNELKGLIHLGLLSFDLNIKFHQLTCQDIKLASEVTHD
jgi:hypothetical protein